MTLYAVTIFLSAFLLFQVQPLIGRVLLPWFGGTPAVWTVCLVFFQVLLLGGYGYVHLLASRFSPRRQLLVHLIVLGASVAILAGQTAGWGVPLLADASLKPPDSSRPALRIVALLLLTVGLPYFVLSTTGPLMQSWMSRSHPGRSPYRLYALSNAGSLLALFSYPFLVEPALALRTQAASWACAYLGFALACAASASGALKVPAVAPPAAGDVVAVRGEPPTLLARLGWVVLAALPSVMLLATTSQMTQEVAVIPFLWILPLCLYLLSFILTFESDRWYVRPVWGALLLLSGTAVGYAIWSHNALKLSFHLGAYLAALFSVCMVCHGELVRRRPGPEHLTAFYLMVSVGGAAGGLFVGLVAPALFQSYGEYPLALGGTCLLFVGVVNARVLPSRVLRALLAFSFGGLATALFILQGGKVDGAVYQDRSFYGLLRVVPLKLVRGPAMGLLHGRTLHGVEFTDAAKRREPTMYFHRESGIGLTLRNHPRRAAGGPLRVGVVGLGIGTLAAYAEPGDVFRFYEINPKVIRLAQGEGGYFKFLESAPGKMEIVEGAARVSLERELTRGSQEFDALVLDAFSSDSVPVHLLTREAFALYLQHLRGQQWIIAANITNHHLDLRPVLRNLARHFHLAAVTCFARGLNGDGTANSRYVLLTPDQELFKHPPFSEMSDPEEELPRSVPLWTDDYSNLVQLVY